MENIKPSQRVTTAASLERCRRRLAMHALRHSPSEKTHLPKPPCTTPALKHDSDTFRITGLSQGATLRAACKQRPRRQSPKGGGSQSSHPLTGKTNTTPTPTAAVRDSWDLTAANRRRRARLPRAAREARRRPVPHIPSQSPGCEGRHGPRLGSDPRRARRLHAGWDCSPGWTQGAALANAQNKIHESSCHNVAEASRWRKGVVVGNKTANQRVAEAISCGSALRPG